MFDVGFWELVLIFGVGLMILGPERMPRVASQLGRWIGRARRTASSLRRQLEQEIASADAPPPPPKRKPTHVTPLNRPDPTKAETETETETETEEPESPASVSADVQEATDPDEPDSAPVTATQSGRDTAGPPRDS